MTKLIVNSNTGYGNCTNEDGTFFFRVKSGWAMEFKRKT